MKILILLIAAMLVGSCTSSNTADNRIDHSKMDHSQMDHSNSANNSAAQPGMDHSTMDHSTMTSSPGASEAPIELQFLDTMILHHQGAVSMAKLSETRAERPEVKKMSVGIIAAQDREITQMKRWRDEWYSSAPPAINLEMAGMSKEHMDTSKLASLSGSEYDIEFVRHMIVHHEEALKMSKAILDPKAAKPPRKELKELAESIIENQNSEIGQMKKWLQEWSK